MKVPLMNIFLKDNAVPQFFEEATQMEIDKHLASGVLVKCDGPTDWCAPEFFVSKGDGKHVRLVMD